MKSAKIRSHKSRVDPKSDMTYKNMKFGYRHTQIEHHVHMKADTEVMLTQVKDRQILPISYQKREKAGADSLSQLSERTNHADILISDF